MPLSLWIAKIIDHGNEGLTFKLESVILQNQWIFRKFFEEQVKKMYLDQVRYSRMLPMHSIPNSNFYTI